MIDSPAMKILSDGLLLAGRYGDFRCGCFVLVNGGRAAIVETPPWNRARNPVNAVRRFVRARRNRHAVERLLLSHSHLDHAGALAPFVEAFPEATLTLHERQVADAGFHWIIRPTLPRAARAEVHAAPLVELSLAGEPLFLIHAPKHSWHDVMVVFRGAMITGDWWLGPGDPNPSRIPEEVCCASVERLLEFSRHYRIHTIISAHANDIRRDLHFGGLMASTLRYHEAKRDGWTPRARRRRRG